MSTETLREELRRRTGHRRLWRGWAKAEIFLGLFAAGVGLVAALDRELPYPVERAAAGVVLFVLGGYLALAGNRSHLYQSANESLAVLVEEIRHVGPREPSDHEHPR